MVFVERIIIIIILFSLHYNIPYARSLFFNPPNRLRYVYSYVLVFSFLSSPNSLPDTFHFVLIISLYPRPSFLYSLSFFFYLQFVFLHPNREAVIAILIVMSPVSAEVSSKKNCRGNEEEKNLRKRKIQSCSCFLLYAISSSFILVSLIEDSFFFFFFFFAFNK